MDFTNKLSFHFDSRLFSKFHILLSVFSYHKGNIYFNINLIVIEYMRIGFAWNETINKTPKIMYLDSFLFF